MSDIVRISVSADTKVIFSEDGRVFYDLDVLANTFEESVAGREFAASLINDPFSDGLVAGERMMLDAIRENREILSLNNAISD